MTEGRAGLVGPDSDVRTLVVCGYDNRLHPLDADGYRCREPRHVAVVYVEAEFEYVRRETVRFVANVGEGMAVAHAAPVIGRFQRTLNFLLHRGRRDNSEQPRIVSWRFVQPTDAEDQATYEQEGFVGNHERAVELCDDTFGQNEGVDHGHVGPESTAGEGA